MRIPIAEIIISQVLFLLISANSAYIAYKFHCSKNGMIRILQIELFSALAFTFGIYGVYYLAWDFYWVPDYPAIYIRLICNAPLAYCLVRYRVYFMG